MPFLFACFLDEERLFVFISVFCSITTRRFWFRFVLSFKLFGYSSEVHLNLVPVEKSSPEWYDPQMKFPPKTQRLISSGGTTDPGPWPLRESESEQNSESNSESESEEESSSEGVSPSNSSESAEDFSGDSPQG